MNFSEANGKIFAYYQLKFHEFQYDEVESFVTYLLQNLIADCGGLLGLFMGISLLSMINTVLSFSSKLITRRKTEVLEESKKLSSISNEKTEILICESPTLPLWIVDYEHEDLSIENISWMEFEKPSTDG